MPGDPGTPVPTPEKRLRALTSAFASAARRRASDTRNEQREGNNREQPSATRNRNATERTTGRESRFPETGPTDVLLAKATRSKKERRHSDRRGEPGRCHSRRSCRCREDEKRPFRVTRRRRVRQLGSEGPMPRKSHATKSHTGRTRDPD